MKKHSLQMPNKPHRKRLSHELGSLPVLFMLLMFYHINKDNKKVEMSKVALKNYLIFCRYQLPCASHQVQTDNLALIKSFLECFD